MRDLVFVKLGGSLITDKRRDAHARHDIIRGLAESVRAALPTLAGGLVLGHGSGSFGHAAAIRHGMRPGEAAPPLAAAHVARAASVLDGLVLDEMLRAGVPALAWSPSTLLETTDGRYLSGGLGGFETALEAGFVPMVYGDVVLDSRRGASIASTEDIARHLEKHLRRRGWRFSLVVWMGETDGIWDAEGEPIRRIDRSNLRRVRRAVGGARGADVTGGMLLRLDTAWQLAQRGVPSLIVDGRRPGTLAAALDVGRTLSNGDTAGRDASTRDTPEVPGTLVIADG